MGGGPIMRRVGPKQKGSTSSAEAQDSPARGVRWERTKMSSELELRRTAEELPVFEELAEAEARPRQTAVEAALSTSSILSEEFRLLRAKVRALAEEQPFRCFGLVSGAPGEGKTTVALGLAVALAHEERDGRRVLLVEADLRKRSLAPYLGLEPIPGLVEWLQQSTSTSLAVRRIGLRGPFLLGAGCHSSSSPDLLSSRRMGRLFEAMRMCFDYVIVDCPPLGPVADAVLLQDLLDGFLLVVRARHSPRETLSRALGHLKQGSIRGVVFNDYREILRRGYGYDYSAYGEGG